jgi:hypothetical protein
MEPSPFPTAESIEPALTPCMPTAGRSVGFRKPTKLKANRRAESEWPLPGPASPVSAFDRREELGNVKIEQYRLFKIWRVAADREEDQPCVWDPGTHQQRGLDTRRVTIASHDQGRDPQGFQIGL